VRYPQSIREGLVVQDVSGERLVYDSARHRVHCLDPLAAAIWEACDGRKSLQTIAEQLTDQLGHLVTTEAVVLGVDRLAQARLLDSRAAGPTRSRRELLREARRGLGAALSLPVVATLVSPIPAEAASIIPAGSCGPTTAGRCCKNPNNINGGSTRRCVRSGLTNNYTCSGKCT